MYKSQWTAVGPLLLLAACGGGSDNDSSESPAAPTIKILEPKSGSVSAGRQALVTGIVSDSAVMSVTVNGQIACLRNGKFSANNVSPDGADGSITATGTLENGKTITDTIKGIRTASVGLTVLGIPCDAPAPYTSSVFLLPHGIGSSGIKAIEGDFDGDGTGDATSKRLNSSLSFTFVKPGTYRPHFTVTLLDGSKHQTEQMVNVLNSRDAEQPFKNLFQDLRSALLSNDTGRVMQYFTPGGRDLYEEDFRALGPDTAFLAEALKTPSAESIDEEIAIYSVAAKRGDKNVKFRLVFLKDEFGNWKIDSL